MRTSRSLVAVGWLCLAVATARADVCIGDCSGAGAVGVDNVLTLVSIVLGTVEPTACSNGVSEGAVDVSTILSAVTNALLGCPPPPFCDLPGSIRTTASGTTIVPGGQSDEPDLTFLQIPDGFCAHYFTTVHNVREMRFAPNGDLFIASPTQFSTGGVVGGQAAILILSDDNKDGYSDEPITFLGGINSSHGLLFANGSLYYQDATAIMRLPYSSGDRQPSGSGEKIADIDFYDSFIHWPKPIDIADDGTIYVGNGGDQGEPCDPARPIHGGILALDDGFPSGRPIAKGLRNPISLRCAHGYNRCYAIELSRDYSNAFGGREKVLPIRDGDDWGFPCCATKDLAYPDSEDADCSTVAQENDSFIIGDTPFDIDYETGLWPAPWNYRAYIPLHGVYSTWTGARLVAIQMDPATGELLMGSDLSGVSSDAMADFAMGWDDGTRQHGRPAAVAFAEDGRLFLGNDNNGVILWIAPISLRMPR